jgi:xanthine/uracil/vitamin C permease (AzgA family)
VIALFSAPAVGAILNAATAPALIIVGSLMISAAGEIEWAGGEYREVFITRLVYLAGQLGLT